VVLPKPKMRAAAAKEAAIAFFFIISTFSRYGEGGRKVLAIDKFFSDPR